MYYEAVRLSEDCLRQIRAVVAGERRLWEEWGAIGPEVPLVLSYQLLTDEEMLSAWVDLARRELAREARQRNEDGEFWIPSRNSRRNRLDFEVFARLQSGEMIAEGVRPGDEVSMRKTRVRAESLSTDLMQLDFSRDIALVDGQVVLRAVTVRRRGSAAAKADKPSKAELIRWLRDEHATKYPATPPAKTESLNHAKRKWPGITRRALYAALDEAVPAWKNRKPGPRGPRRANSAK
jgi:hypothetical protein